MARSTARKRALNTLYEADEKGQDIPSLLEERIASPGAQTPLPEYAVAVVRGVADHKTDIDSVLGRYSTRWTLRRMAVVDRNVLRIAAWEILFNDEVPDRVAVDEALGLAKTLSDDESPSFIHGLLSAICDNKDAALAQIKEAEEEREEQARREAALHAPTAPGFLKSGGISGHGDGVAMQWDDTDEASNNDSAEVSSNDTDGASSDDAAEASNNDAVSAPEDSSETVTANGAAGADDVDGTEDKDGTDDTDGADGTDDADGKGDGDGADASEAASAASAETI